MITTKVSKTTNRTVKNTNSLNTPIISSIDDVNDILRNTLNITVNGTDVTIPLTQYNPNAGPLTPDYSAIVKGLILKMANGENKIGWSFN